MANTSQDFRREQRVSKELEAVLSGIENGKAFEEVVEITSLSRMGAGFRISRELPVGSLILLKLQMPNELRAYDFTKKLYRVIGLMQHCHMSAVSQKTSYDAGIAFTGKNFPSVYKKNPLQSFRISGITRQGLWKIYAAKTMFKPRLFPRFSVKLDVVVSLIQKSRDRVIKEKTVTRNISAKGASFPFSLNAEVGEKVKFACEKFDFYALAVIRNRNETASTLHLEFIDAVFPIYKLSLSENATRNETELRKALTSDNTEIQQES